MGKQDDVLRRRRTRLRYLKFKEPKRGYLFFLFDQSIVFPLVLIFILTFEKIRQTRRKECFCYRVIKNPVDYMGAFSAFSLWDIMFF